MIRKMGTIIPAIIILCFYIMTITCTQKTQTTRTALHVARSLDPDSMESVSVKTRTGDLTTIIVKKRAGRTGNLTESGSDANITAPNYILLSSSEIKANNSVDNKIETITPFLLTTNMNITAHNQSSQNRTDRSEHISIPAPVLVSSSMVYVKNDQGINNSKKSRSLIKLDIDGIPVVTGVRVPDDDSDKQVWRNARVINGILVPYDKSDKDIITKHKPLRKPSTMRPTDNNMWTRIGSVTKQPTKLSPPNPELMKEASWNDEKWELFKKPVTLKPTVEQPQVLQTIEIVEDLDRGRPSTSEYTQHPAGLWIQPDTDENLEHKYVTDRILEYIRNINKEEMKRLTMQKFTARDARMLPTTDEPPQIQSRILHVPGASVFPNSAMYTPSTQPPSRVSFEEGVRTPVLQYAHPEYGVQAAKADSNVPEISEKRGSSYYGQDIHADRGPFVFEPAAPTDQIDPATSTNNKRSQSTTSYYQRPKKTLAYFYPEKQIYHPHHKPYEKYPKDDYKTAEYPAIYYEDLDGRPFWIRIGDSLKEQMQSGIDKMTDLTRPVMEPLVEATHKISHNLGFSSGNRDLSTLREKLGTVSTSSLILPAIGIVAGGAALGLGAVAVGRYLNYDVVKMRKAKSMTLHDDLSSDVPDPTDTSHLDALWAEDKSRSSTFQETSTPSTTTTLPTPTTSSENPKIRRRRATMPDLNKYFDNILQNVESHSDYQMQTENYPASMWSNTPCSKRIFCETMLAQPQDSIAFMDKKIYTFLSILHSDVAAAVAPHLEEVMKSVKAGNCSVHVCPWWKTTSRSKLNGV